MERSRLTPTATSACPRGLAPPDCLPPHLQRLLPLIAEGLSNQEIADTLFLTVHTVENYVSELMSHCDCHSRVRLAIRFQQYLALQTSKEPAP